MSGRATHVIPGRKNQPKVPPWTPPKSRPGFPKTRHNKLIIFLEKLADVPLSGPFQFSAAPNTIVQEVGQPQVAPQQAAPAAPRKTATKPKVGLHGLVVIGTGKLE